MELPQLQDLWSEVIDETGKEAMFLCINRGDSLATIDGYWEKEAYEMRYARQKGTRVGDAFGVIAYPTNYIIGPDGKVLYRSARWEPEKVRKALLGG